MIDYFPDKTVNNQDKNEGSYVSVVNTVLRKEFIVESQHL